MHSFFFMNVIHNYFSEKKRQKFASVYMKFYNTIGRYNSGDSNITHNSDRWDESGTGGVGGRLEERLQKGSGRFPEMMEIFYNLIRMEVVRVYVYKNSPKYTTKKNLHCMLVIPIIS